MTELGRRVLIGLAIASLILLGYVAAPFGEAILMAAVLAAAFSRPFERLTIRLGGRRVLAAGFVVTMVVFALVLPVIGIVLAVAQQADDAIRPMRATFEAGGVDGLVASLPAPLPDVAREVIRRLPRGSQQVEELVRSGTGKLLGGVGYVFLATGNVLFHLVMMLVGFFFFLVDGPALVRWMIRTSPLTEEQVREFLQGFRDVSVAVLLGSVGTALVQTFIALVGFWIAGAPHPLLLSVATFIAAFIPVVGAGSVVVVSAVVLFFSGHSGGALFLLIWGVGVVSTIDNFVKPLLMRGRMEIATGVTFFALLGGVAAFGPVGLLAGPLIVAFALAVARMCQRELGAVREIRPDDHRQELETATTLAPQDPTPPSAPRVVR
jgi:predicted PurR-regulated permease PerM